MITGTRQKVNIMGQLYLKIIEIVLENVTDKKSPGYVHR
jgi:hypothetical protein